MTSLPTITLRESYRRSDDHVISCIYRRSDDHVIYFFTDDPTITFRFFCRKLPTIRRSHFGFFPENYRRSDDQISVFFPKITNDPTITFRFFFRKVTYDPTIKFWFFCRKLPTIRRSVLGFFPQLLDTSESALLCAENTTLRPPPRDRWPPRSRKP